MAAIDLEEAYKEFCHELLLEAQATGEPKHATFFRMYSSLAAENGDCIDLTYEPASKEGRGGYQVDGYALDLDRGELYLAACDYRQDSELEQLHAADISGLMQKVHRFCELAREQSFINGLEEASPAFRAAYPIYEYGDRIKRIRVTLFSNARLSMRRSPQLDGDLNGIPVVCNLLDFGRYADIDRSRTGAEPIEVDIVALNGSPLACLPAHGASASYESYLIAMPGELLSKIYGLYGARLLEQNVRTFLQARTKVNAGIIRTLTDAPEMFFAYNNGITATSSGVKTTTLPNGAIGVASIENLQIVNGGQTTASILYSKDQNKADLSHVFVQVKLSVVRPDLVEQIVPKISRFANTQNRISEADFASSDAFQLAMEKVSRRLSAPPRAGALTASKWFYERARGQYKDAQAYGTTASRKKLELEYPKEQVIDKTDFAKHEMTWRCAPHTVSLGAQKCFLEFSESVGLEWAQNELAFNDEYFRRAVAKAILFRWVDHMVGTSDWYQSDRGYKAQIVTYTIAWVLSHIRKNMGSELHVGLLWTSQDLPDELKQALRSLAPLVAGTIKDAPPHIKNVGEYCKQGACWARVSSTAYAVELRLDNVVVDRRELKEQDREASNVRKLDKDIELDVILATLSPKAGDIAAVAKARGLLSPKSESALQKIARKNFSLSTSERNAIKYLLSRLQEQGIEVGGEGKP
jgi:hypothetical protein